MKNSNATATLSAEIASLNTQLARLKTQSKPAEAQATEVQARLDKARLEYEAFQASLYAAHPELKVQRGQTKMLTFARRRRFCRTIGPQSSNTSSQKISTYLFVLRKATQRATAVDV